MKTLCGRCHLEVANHVPIGFRIPGRECFCQSGQELKISDENALKDVTPRNDVKERCNALEKALQR